MVGQACRHTVALNDAALRLFGYSREEFMALNHDALLRSHAVTPRPLLFSAFSIVMVARYRWS